MKRTPLTTNTRRQTLRTAGSLAASAALASVPGIGSARITTAPPSESLSITPSGPVGPFYPQQFSPTPTASLIQAGSFNEASTPTVILSGRLTDPAGRPLSAVRIEIWQCDQFGQYHHSRDSVRSERAPGFLGFGWQTTDAQGRYQFTTIEPPPYPGRTPHIHLAVISNTTGEVTERFATQIYLPTEQQRNQGDSLYRSLGDKAPLSTATRQADQLRFDLVMRNQGW